MTKFHHRNTSNNNNNNNEKQHNNNIADLLTVCSTVTPTANGVTLLLSDLSVSHCTPGTTLLLYLEKVGW